MNIVSKLFLVGLTLIANSAFALFGLNVGPFDLRFDAYEPNYYVEHRVILDDPICYAIANQKKLVITLEGSEKVSANELKVITKQVTVEPYAYGLTKEGKPVLRGNVVEDKLVREVTVKYGEDKFDVTDKEKKGYFSGWFNSDKVKDLDIRKINSIDVIQGSHFDAPKDVSGLNKDYVQVLCQIPTGQ